MAGYAVRRAGACLAALLWAAAGLTQGADAGQAPQRVVSTNLCADEYVFRLVPAGRIAALSYLATDTHPQVSTIAGKAAGIRAIRPGVETILTLHPDLVVMQTGMHQRLRNALRNAGIAVVDLPWANSLADIRATTRMLGQALGAPQRAEALLRAMDRKLQAARRQAPHPAVTAMFYQPNGYVLMGGYADEILATAGGTDVSASLHPGRTGSVPVEMLLARRPQLILLSGTGTAGNALAARPLHHPALAALKGRAVIADIDTRPLLCPGPWSADAAAAFSIQTRRAAGLAPAKPQH